MLSVCMCSPPTCSSVVHFLCFRFSLYVYQFIDNKEANVNDPSHAVHYNRNMIQILYNEYILEHNITKMCNQVAVIYESDDGIVVGRQASQCNEINIIIRVYFANDK